MLVAVSEVRAEGLTVAMASDAQVTSAIELASEVVERNCGVPFHEVSFTSASPLLLDGPGRATLHLDVPINSVTEVGYIDGAGAKTPEVLTNLVVYNRRAGAGLDDRLNPKIEHRYGTWTRGLRNVYFVGKVGWTDLSPDPAGGSPSPLIERAPVEIRRAVLLLVINDFAWLLTDEQRQGDRVRRWITSETTEGHSYSLSSMAASGGSSGIREADRIMSRYRRPRAFFVRPSAEVSVRSANLPE
jgi:hypothetical protein